METDNSQALIGFVKQADQVLPHLAADVDNEFCSIVLTSLDSKPIGEATKLLLTATARAANSGMKWNSDRTTLEDWGSAPTVIEPVSGTVSLRNLKPFSRVAVIPLDSGAKPLEPSIPTETTGGGCRIPIGKPATPWYLVRIER